MFKINRTLKKQMILIPTLNTDLNHLIKMICILISNNKVSDKANEKKKVLILNIAPFEIERAFIYF